MKKNKAVSATSTKHRTYNPTQRRNAAKSMIADEEGKVKWGRKDETRIRSPVWGLAEARLCGGVYDCRPPVDQIITACRPYAGRGLKCQFVWHPDFTHLSPLTWGVDWKKVEVGEGHLQTFPKKRKFFACSLFCTAFFSWWQSVTVIYIPSI